MATTKEDLINSLVIRLADSTNISVRELKNAIAGELYDYSVEKVECTELSTGNGSATDYLMNYFIVGKMSANMAEGSIQRYKEAIYQLCKFCNKELNMITAEDINNFLYRYKKLHNCQDSTMDSKRLYFSSVFGYLYKHKKIEANPMHMVEGIKCKVKVKTPLSDEEMERIRMACEKRKRCGVRDIAMVNFMVDSGVRVSELCSINLEDVDFVNQKCKVLGKGNKERYVFFSARTKVRLQEYFNTRKDIQFGAGGMMYSLETPLFVGVDRRCKRLKKPGVENIMKKLGEISGVTRLHPHLLRATFATNLARKGVELNVIAKALGHANLSTIGRYVLLSSDQINSTLRGIGSVA